jgi:hypothetical protein
MAQDAGLERLSSFDDLSTILGLSHADTAAVPRTSKRVTSAERCLGRPAKVKTRRT